MLKQVLAAHASLMNRFEEDRAELTTRHRELMDKLEQAHSEAQEHRRHAAVNTRPAAPAAAQVDESVGRLALTYEAWRTLLARRSAAAVFFAERADEGEEPRDDGAHIRIAHAPFDETREGWQLVVVTAAGKERRAAIKPTKQLPILIHVEGLDEDTTLWRIEIRDKNDLPIWLGLGPAIDSRPLGSTNTGVPAPTNPRTRSDG